VSPPPLRGFVAVADSRELAERPELLRAFAAEFRPDDDLTLVVHAADLDRAAAELGDAVPDDGPDVVLVPSEGVPWVARPRAALSERAVEALPSFGADDMPALRARLESGTRRRVVIAVEHFHPSVGGVERLAEGLGSFLQRHDWDVAVAAHPHPDREAPVHLGLVVHEIPLGDELGALERVVDATGAEAVIGLEAYPTAYPNSATLQLRRPVRRIVKACVNEDAYRIAHETPGFLPFYDSVLRAADGIVVSSHGGWDVRLAGELGAATTYIPNAGAEIPPAPGSFRARHGIGADERVLLVVANFWPEKNQLGLLDAAAGSSGDWRLVLVGGDSPQFPELGARIREAAAQDPRVLLAGAADRAEVSAAMEEADLLLLPSKAEATPLVLVEAMGHRLPWLATPTCGSARDLCGGVIVPVERFPALAGELLADDGTRASLGAAGRAHWETTYTWDAVGARYLALLDGLDPGAPPEPPAQALAVTAAARERFAGPVLRVA
jgi:glycosyltransferase involved in cell wall biosynthesis